MKQLLYTIIFILIFDLSFQRCANPGRPSGGPKDTIPPTLIYSSPTSGTLNFNESLLELEFSEYINADKLKQQLIITPSTDLNYKAIVKRNKLAIKLEGDLQDSTTYNFNFANGVTDITEKNPAVNLSIAISTGPFIDSMSVKGSVEYLINQEPGKGFVIGLYPLTDSLDVFTDKPMYFTTANDSGNYEINYIKTGNYKIISFEDDNGNFLLDPDNEPHGFLSDTIQLDSATNLPVIRCVLQNIKPLKLINTRSIGSYVEVKFNKTVDSITIEPMNPYNLIGESKDVLRLYKPESINYNDTITSYIQASDSVGNTILDTIKYVFLESNRKPANFTYSFVQNKLELTDKPQIQLSFSKPIDTLIKNKISIQADSLLRLIPTFDYSWNRNNTKVDLTFDITESFIDSLQLSITPTDTVTTDSISLNNSITPSELLLFIEEGAFISVENDSSSEKSTGIRKVIDKPKGVLNVTLDTDLTHYEFQLLNTSNEVVQKISNTSTFSLEAVQPGKYKIRILIDSDKDGTWTYGNLLKNKEPEEVFIYEEQTSIRENWVVELSITF